TDALPGDGAVDNCCARHRRPHRRTFGRHAIRAIGASGILCLIVVAVTRGDILAGVHLYAVSTALTWPSIERESVVLSGPLLRTACGGYCTGIEGIAGNVRNVASFDDHVTGELAGRVNFSIAAKIRRISGRAGSVAAVVEPLIRTG